MFFIWGKIPIASSNQFYNQIGYLYFKFSFTVTQQKVL